MLRFCLIILLALSACDTPRHEVEDVKCMCAEEVPSNDVYYLSKNDQVALCGYYDSTLSSVINEDIYVEAVLIECNTSKKVYEWGAVQNCTVEQNKDTIVVKEFYLLPIGDSFSLEWEPFYITNIYLQDSTIKKEHYFVLNKNNYTTVEINSIINNYDQTTDKTYSWNSEKYLNICYQLFWCYVSGEEKAYDYLQEAEDKFGGFSGHIAEEHQELIRTIDKINKQ